ncbi:MAG TPA: transcriptional regulator [Stellaceae bacterium]|nr:transcriptional regulator [Stellaceae bacterium]
MRPKNDTIAPIRDDASHQAALAEIERLWGSAEHTPQGDRLEVLMTLVDAYERLRWPDEDVDPVDAIKARMENSGRTRKDFEEIAGSSGRASEILNRRRRLTLAMVWKLVRQWDMPADLLVQPYALSRPKRHRRHRRPRKDASRARAKGTAARSRR